MTLRIGDLALAARSGAVLHMAMADPTNVFAVDPVQFRTGLKVKPMVAAESAIARAVLRLYGEEKGIVPVSDGARPSPGPGGAAAAELNPHDIPTEGVEVDPGALVDEDADVEQVRVGPEEIDLVALTRGSGDRPVVDQVNRILVEAYRRGASDIHVEPAGGGAARDGEVRVTRPDLGAGSPSAFGTTGARRRWSGRSSMSCSTIPMPSARDWDATGSPSTTVSRFYAQGWSPEGP